MATVRNGVVDEERYAGLALPEKQIDVEKLLRLIEYGLTPSGPGPKVFSSNTRIDLGGWCVATNSGT